MDTKVTNYCGITPDLIEYISGTAPSKQGKFLPGSHIPVVSKEEIKKDKPDYILVLPWNIKEEIMAQLDYIRAWEGKFLIVVPDMHVL
jgi:ABC-type Fe3+-hydroxamate transport system substrate-binding protein